ncbi:hypothetical protein GCM10028809_42330 [Spirosoma gilvum]
MSFYGNSVHYKTFRHDNSNSRSLSESSVTALAIDSQHTLWVGTKHGQLDRFNGTDESFSHFQEIISPQASFKQAEILTLLSDKKGSIWIGKTNGLAQLEVGTTKVTHYQNDPNNPKSLNDNNIFAIFQDQQATLWLGTYYGGVNVLTPNNTPFKVIKAGLPGKGLSFKIVSQIREDSQRNLWIGSDGAGLDFLNTQTGQIKHYGAGPNPKMELPTLQVKSVYVDREGYTWVGIRRGGISRLDPAHKEWVSYRYTSKDSSLIASDIVYALLEDSRQQFWVLTDKGISILSKKQGILKPLTGKPSRVAQIDTLKVRSILEDKEHNIWLGYSGGIYLLENGSNRLIWLPFTKNKATLSQHILCIHQDRLGNIWAGTRKDGLKRFDKTQHKFVNYTKADGLKSTIIFSIQSDPTGILWLGTEQGLTRFDPIRKSSLVYTAADNISGSEFEADASYQRADGTLYFGTNDGLVYFHPAAVRLNTQVPTVAFTSLDVLNKPITIGDETHLLSRDISQTDQLVFNYQQNFFSINFAVLNYINPEKNQYAYKLKGIDHDWHYLKNPSVTFTNLAPGHYTLLVKGANNDGVWSMKPAQIGIIVRPPFWRTWWANCLYFLAFFVVLYLILRTLWLKETLRREQDLNQAKLDFFTNISHEIRTHLTLIVGPIDMLLLNKKKDKEVQTQLTYAKNSSGNLLNLVSELLDFRKAEANQLPLRITNNDLVSFVRNSLNSFQYETEKRKINLLFSANKDAIHLWFDPDQLAKVIYNLLANAYKFIHDGGEIDVRLEEETHVVKIRITDNGKGIAKENVKNLFTNYFQVYDFDSKNTGYGIGLALAKTITELHHGTLIVESREASASRPGYTCFIVTLLKGNSHFTKEQLADPVLSWIDQALNTPTNPIKRDSSTK